MESEDPVKEALQMLEEIHLAVIRAEGELGRIKLALKELSVRVSE